MLLLLVFLLSCWIVSGIQEEDSPVQHHGLRNRSVCLHVKKPSLNITWGSWTFNRTLIASTFQDNPAYRNKVIFSKENLSLCVNELRDLDAGKYEVTFGDSQYNSRKELHQVIIQDMVPRPVMAVHRSNLSAASCRFTVNCSIHDEWATSQCDADECKTSQTSTHKFNISIFKKRSAAVCRGNNHVSTNQASESIDACVVEPNVGHEEKFQEHLKVIIAILVCSVLCVCVVVLAQRLHNRCPKSTARLIQSQPVETPSQEEPRASTSSSCQAEPCYENMEQPQPPDSATGQPGSTGSPTADTVYSYPDVTASAPKSDGSRDTSGREGADADNTSSQSAAVGETQQRSEVDTVYCLLQMPGEREVTAAPPTGQNRI